MKQKLLKSLMFLTLCLGISTMIYAQPQVIQVAAAPEAIGDAFLDAFPGDIIELTTSGGVYTDSVGFKITQDVTIRAAAGLAEKPVIDADGKDLFDVTGGGLNLKGIKMINMYYGINASLDAGITSEDLNLRIDDCIFDGFYRCILVGDGMATAFDSILVTNTIFRNGEKQGMYLKRTFNNSGLLPGGFKYGKIENCLFHHITNSGDGHPLYIEPGDRTNSTDYPKLLINHVTVDSCKFGIFTYCFPGPEITNCVISNLWGFNPIDPEYAFGTYPAYFMDAPPAQVTNCIYSHGVLKLDNKDYNVTNVFTNVDSVTAQYVDAANGDYSLVAGTAGTGAGTDGKDLGYIAPASTKINTVKYDASVRVYPNPTMGIVRISIGNDISEASSIEIFDVTGKVVKRVNDLNGRRVIELDLSSVEAGMYFGMVKASGQNHTFKVLKK